MQKKDDNLAPAKPWQPRWWREDPERWRWAGTIALVFVLMGAFAYQNPDIWRNNIPPQQVAEEDTGVGLPEPAERQPPAPVIVGRGILDAPLLADEPPAPLLADESPAPLLADEPTDAEDTEPAGMQQLEAAIAVAVSTAPASWQQPGYGVWARGYGYALDPNQGDYRFHHGCDMELSVGSPVFAAAGGKVLLAAEDAAWGGVVIVEHGGGWRSVYRGLKPEVSVDAELVAGEQIGLILPSPPAERAQSSHLHFEMECASQPQNPAQWL